MEVNHLFCLWNGRHPNSSKCTSHETPTTNSRKCCFTLFYQAYHCFNKTLSWKRCWPQIVGYCHILGFWDPNWSFIFPLLLAGQKSQYTDWIHQPLMRLGKMFPYVYSWPWKVKIQNWTVFLFKTQKYWWDKAFLVTCLALKGLTSLIQIEGEIQNNSGTLLSSRNHHGSSQT